MQSTAQHLVLIAHQWTEGNNLEDALQCEEGCENDVKVLQHGLVQVRSSVELMTEGKTDTEYIFGERFQRGAQ